MERAKAMFVEIAHNQRFSLEMSEVGWFAWCVLPQLLFLPLQHLLEGQCYPHM